MTVPQRAIYHQPSLSYAGAGVSRYAHELGLDGVLLHTAASSDEVRRAGELGLHRWWWSGPSSWKPDTWRATMQRIERRASELGVRAFFADVETHDAWRRAGRGARDELADELESRASRGWSVGFGSFPAWPWWRDFAARCPSVWSSPQLYGIRNPARTYAALRARGRPWEEAWSGGYVPTLAGAYRRTPEQQRAYLAAMGPRGILFSGQTMPRPQSPLWLALHDWARGVLEDDGAAGDGELERGREPRRRTPSGAAGLGVLGALGFLGWAVTRRR